MKTLYSCCCLTLAMLFFPKCGWSQKKWDGQGNDSLWTNPRNWFPDGLPGATEDVVLDNSIINVSYHVVMNADSGSISIRSLTISPQAKVIRVELPVSNKIAPALSLSAASNSLVIGPNGFFLNKSGALAGNSMELSGNLLVLNDGTYIHATNRGNANIVSKLSSGPSTSRGLFIFDVPGTSGYTVSITGRQFGILRFQSLQSGKKSYSGSGSSNLTLWGGLEIEDSTTVTTTLTGNVIVNGNLEVKGKLSLLPATTGTSGRELQMSGNNSSVRISGLIETGSNFRMMMVSAGTTFLRSNIRLDKETCLLKVATGAKLDLDSFSIVGPGWMVSDSGSTLKSSHSFFKTSDSTKGSLRSTFVKMHKNTHYSFYGNLEQHTGEAFPDTIGMLTISKTAQWLFIDKPLIILDSLHLQQGVLNTDSLRRLTLLGGLSGGSRQSFIDGPLTREIKDQNVQSFPVGMNQNFHPSSIQGQTGTVQVTYFHQHPPRATDRINPVESLVDSGFWQIEKKDNDPNFSGVIAILDSMASPTTYLRNRRIVQLKNDGWTIAQPTSQINSISFADGQENGFSPILLSIGMIQPSALPLDRIVLSLLKKDQGIQLEWFGDWGEEHWQIQIEESTNGRQFIPILMDQKQWTFDGNHYRYGVSYLPEVLMYFRICATNEVGKKVYSNIVHANSHSLAFRCFPNPATDKIHIQLPEGKWKTLKTVASDGRVIDISLINRKIEISKDISKLPMGTYYMKVDDGVHSFCIPFIKK